MNPRILKKLSKRVVDLGLFDRGLYKELDHGQEAEYRPRGASKKPTHRGTRWRPGQEDRHPMGDMYVLPGTMWICWTNSSMDGDDHDSAVAWALAEEHLLGELRDAALDWENFDYERSSWPDWKGGKPPKLPRSTSAKLRLIKQKAAGKKLENEARRHRLAARLAA